MKRHIEAVLMSLFIFLAASCAKPISPPIEARPVYTEKFITVHLRADPRLNLYQGASHALHLCIYQLIDPNPFNQFLEDETGIGNLLNCERFDGGVAISRRLVIQPGQDLAFELDRAEGARYVGLVAGYYSLRKEHVARLFTIPTVEEKKGGMIVQRQVPLHIELFLGPQALHE